MTARLVPAGRGADRDSAGVYRSPGLDPELGSFLVLGLADTVPTVRRAATGRAVSAAGDLGDAGLCQAARGPADRGSSGGDGHPHPVEGGGTHRTSLCRGAWTVIYLQHVRPGLWGDGLGHAAEESHHRGTGGSDWVNCHNPHLRPVV